MTIRYRKAETLGDFKTCIDLIREHISAIGICEAAFYLDITPTSLMKIYRDGSSFCLLCFADAKPVGIIALAQQSARDGRINYFFVKPVARGVGIGTFLLCEVVARARASGCETLSLSTLPELKRACALYERTGFRLTGPVAGDLPGAVGYALEL